MINNWQKFQLRHSVLIFAVFGFVAVVSAMVLTWWLISRTTQASVIRSTEASNFALTAVFANEVWGDIRTLLPAPELGAEGARDNPFLMALDKGELPAPNFRDGVQNQRVLDAAERAAAAGRWERV